MSEPHQTSTLRTLVRQAAFCTAIIGLLQPVLAVASLVTQVPAVSKMHGGFGYLFVAAAVVTAVLAALWLRRGGPRAALPLALALAIGGAVQAYWGLLSVPVPGKLTGPIVTFHMGLGLVLAFAAFALYGLGRSES